MSLKTRLILAVLVITTSVLLLLPTFLSSYFSEWPGFIKSRMLKLGLDLKGGIHLVFEIDSDKHRETLTYRMLNQLRSALGRDNIDYMTAQVSLEKINITLLSDDDVDKVMDLINRDFPELRIIQATGDNLTVSLNTAFLRRSLKEASSRATGIIRNRVDQFGVTEPDVREQAGGRILVQLPGIEDPRRAIALIGKTALLELKLVAEGKSPEEVLGLPDYEVLNEFQENESGRTTKIPYVVEKQPLLTGDMLKSARVGFDQMGSPVVNIEFNQEGARLFSEVTSNNVGRRLAIVLDGIIYSAPVIREAIRGGRGQISGSFTPKGAHDLAIVLRAGALPAPVKMIEQTTVGPSLGKESISKGSWSLAIGFILVVVFMAFYYKTSGLIADVCVMLNIVLILASLSLLGATLTLPGIAGIVLTVGIAVDANVLILERVREEILAGLSLQKAIDEGFNRAFLTIIDTHVTTLVSAGILYYAGTGPIKGFAVTLFIGLLASLFTAVFLSRLMMDWLMHRNRERWLSF